MNMLINSDVLYVFRNSELMTDAIMRPAYHPMLARADYAFRLTYTNGVTKCAAIKDRSGIFNMEHTMPLKTVMAVVKVLLKDVGERK